MVVRVRLTEDAGHRLAGRAGVECRPHAAKNQWKEGEWSPNVWKDAVESRLHYLISLVVYPCCYVPTRTVSSTAAFIAAGS